jgi:hypothetical protein
MDQLISAQLTERKQSKHFLEEYESLRTYITRAGTTRMESCQPLLYLWKELDRVLLFGICIQYPGYCFMSANEWRASCFYFL